MTEPEGVGCGVDDVPFRLGSDGSTSVSGVLAAFFLFLREERDRDGHQRIVRQNPGRTM